MIAAQVIFWCSVILLAHSYFIYPLLIRIISAGKKQNENCFSLTGELPEVSILLAVFNEEEVMNQKILSTMDSSYPLSNLEFLIGSDASTDDTEEIIRRCSVQFPQIKYYPFKNRTGKAGIMNHLAARAGGEVLLLTDANVLFSRQTIFELVKHFKNDSIALVAGNILNSEVKNDGISKQESAYQAFENNLKYREGVLWGAMMGAFGGCYAVRSEYFSPTPENFIVDDFYITLAALEKGGKAICELEASCYEDVSNLSKEEFRRKSRIATGNFQILRRFWKLLSPARGEMAFAFFSHKILRWLGPFFILTAYLSSFVLSFQHDYYKFFFWIQTLLLLTPLIDLVLIKLKIHLHGLRYISHFYMMNLAMLNGFFKFLRGVKHNVWQPTQRNQSTRN